MLTMQGDKAKRAIVAEAFRVLRPGGRYAIHELGLTPDGIAQDTRTTSAGRCPGRSKVNAPADRTRMDAIAHRGRLRDRHRRPSADGPARPAPGARRRGAGGCVAHRRQPHPAGAARRRVIGMRRTFTPVPELSRRPSPSSASSVTHSGGVRAAPRSRAPSDGAAGRQQERSSSCCAPCAIRWTRTWLPTPCRSTSRQRGSTCKRLETQEMCDGRARGRQEAGRPKLTYEPVRGWTYARHRRPVRHPPRRYGRRAGSSAPGGSARIWHRVWLARPARPADAGRPGVAAPGRAPGFQVRSVFVVLRDGHGAAVYLPVGHRRETAPEVVRGIQQGLIKEVIDRNVTRHRPELPSSPSRRMRGVARASRIEARAPRNPRKPVREGAGMDCTVAEKRCAR